jgi:short-subunit dehydrogenase
MALQMAKSGAKLALAARRHENLETIAKKCRDLGGEAIAIACDVSKSEDCERTIAQTVEHFGKLDILINNAGITMWSLFEDIADLASMKQIMEINYYGAVYCTYYALPHLKKSKGRIVAVSSLTGKTGVPTRSLYAGSKHAMAGFFDSLRIELAGSGVSVITTYPGFVATATREKGLDGKGGQVGDSPVKEGEIMSAETCAAIILDAIAKRKREVVFTLRGKIGMFLKPFFPKFLDRIAAKAIAKGK